MNNPGVGHAPEAILFTSPACPHCPALKKILQGLHDSGQLSQLQLHDVNHSAELAQQLGVRSIPWFRIGELEFQGLHSAGELQYWAAHANDAQGILRYISQALEAGQLSSIEKMIHRHPPWLQIAIQLLADMQAPLSARIGLGAILESLQDDPILETVLPQLVAMSQHSDFRVRSDACHYLGLFNNTSAREALQTRLTDEHAEVREIARESLEA